MKNNYKYFIENESQEWYSFVFRGMHTTSNNPHYVCGCADCQNVSQWTKDPLQAVKFDSENEAVEFLVAKGWLECKVTEHEFVTSAVRKTGT